MPRPWAVSLATESGAQKDCRACHRRMQAPRKVNRAQEGCVSEFLNGLMVVSLSAGPVALWLLLLNARDRRSDSVAILVRRICEAPSLRGRVAMTVRAPLLSRRIAVVLDMSECCTEDVWSTACGLAGVLPYHVALAIETRLDGVVPVAVVLGRAVCPTATHSSIRNSHRRPLGYEASTCRDIPNDPNDSGAFSSRLKATLLAPIGARWLPFTATARPNEQYSCLSGGIIAFGSRLTTLR